MGETDSLWNKLCLVYEGCEKCVVLFLTGTLNLQKVLACFDPAMPRGMSRNQSCIVLLNSHVLAAPQELSADALYPGANTLRHLCPLSRSSP